MSVTLSDDALTFVAVVHPKWDFTQTTLVETKGVMEEVTATHKGKNEYILIGLVPDLANNPPLMLPSKVMGVSNSDSLQGLRATGVLNL